MNIAAVGSKPIYVIKTDESDEMIVRANDLLNKIQVKVVRKITSL